MNDKSSNEPVIKTINFKFKDWTITVSKSHILNSKCYTPNICVNHSIDDLQNSNELCKFCLFNKELNLPQIPEMSFADNVLRINHKNGYGVEFNCLDALKLVNDKQDMLKVPVSDSWLQSRKDNENIKNTVKPFDWTYSTDYQGTVLPDDKNLMLLENNSRSGINYEKLKIREKILFYDEIHLFEDELADNGCAVASARIRVMESGFFILFRFFLRIDNLILRLNDTRIHYEVGNDFLTKEFTSKEAMIADLKIPPALFVSPDELCPHLPTKKEVKKVLRFPG